jgi:hypothetical protein
MFDVDDGEGGASAAARVIVPLTAVGGEAGGGGGGGLASTRIAAHSRIERDIAAARCRLRAAAAHRVLAPATAWCNRLPLSNPPLVLTWSEHEDARLLRCVRRQLQVPSR